MNIEDKALLANIATILVKDIGLDRKRITKKTPLILFDDSDDELDEFICALQRKRYKLSSTNSVQKLKKGISECYYSLNLLALENKIFQKSLHFTEETYMNLIKTLAPLVPDKFTKINDFFISKESIISLGLWKAATDEHFHKISKRFEVPRTICIIIIKHFYSIMASNYEKFINWPTIDETKSINNYNYNPEISSIFTKLYGILGCKPMAIYLEDQNDEIPLLLHISCNANGIITYCYVANSNSIDRTPLGQIVNGGIDIKKIPNDYYLIGDCSFPLHKHIITPFRLPSNEKKRDFNLLTEKTITIATNVFKIMFKRFHTLFALEAYDIDEVRKIITTICILHNLCQKFDDKCILENSDFEFGEQIKNKSNEDDIDGLTKRLELMDNIL